MDSDLAWVNGRALDKADAMLTLSSALLYQEPVRPTILQFVKRIIAALITLVLHSARIRYDETLHRCIGVDAIFL